MKRIPFIFILGLILLYPLTVIETATKGTSIWVEVLRTSVRFPCTVAGFQNQSHGIIVGWRGQSFSTIDGGKKWSMAGASSWYLDREQLEILNNRIAWNCGNGNEIMMTTDGGKNWSRISNYGYGESSLFGTKGVKRYLSFSNSHTGWVASESKLSKTNDAGENWTDLKLPPRLTGSIGAIALYSSREGFLLEREKNGVLYFTKDAGRTWNSRRIGFKVQLFPVTIAPSVVMRFTTTKRGIIIANCKTIKGNQIWSFTTLDGGKSWKQELIRNGFGNLFLTHNGQLLTIYDGYGQITVLKYLKGISN